jgi:hypothetical protein
MLNEECRVGFDTGFLWEPAREILGQEHMFFSPARFSKQRKVGIDPLRDITALNIRLSGFLILNRSLTPNYGGRSIKSEWAQRRLL